MTVVFICRDCGKPFAAQQGSRRQYCEKCLAKRVLLGGRPKKGAEQSIIPDISESTRSNKKGGLQ